MNRKSLLLTLRDDVVFSERNATQGGHSCLDYIPGSTLLGAAAARLYKALKDDAWMVFHSGKFRFGSGLPVAANGQLAFPVPLCWHHDKKEVYKRKDNRIIAGNVRNLMHGKFDDKVQPQQIRGGYVTGDGQLLQPDKRLSMKTAINPETWRHADEQLFGYESIRAGQRYLVTISADGDVSQKIFNDVCEALTGTLRLGRSKLTEYGRVQSEVVDDNEEAIIRGQVESKEITLWLLSDLAAKRHAQPVFDLKPQDLGLLEGKLIRKKSFIRTRRYAPFNAFRHAPEPERQVICAGSILCFKLADHPGEDFVIPPALGLWQECGLGCVWSNPPLLSGFETDISKLAVPPVKPSETATASRPSHGLVRWLEYQSENEEKDCGAVKYAGELAEELERLYEYASSLAGAKNGEIVGPGSSQWGRVGELALEYRSDPGKLKETLFDNGGPCKDKNNEDWNREAGQDDRNNNVTFGGWLKKRLFQGESDETEACAELSGDMIPAVLGNLAKLAQDIVTSLEGKS